MRLLQSRKSRRQVCFCYLLLLLFVFHSSALFREVFVSYVFIGFHLCKAHAHSIIFILCCINIFVPLLVLASCSHAAPHITSCSITMRVTAAMVSISHGMLFTHARMYIRTHAHINTLDVQVHLSSLLIVTQTCI